MSDRQLHLLSPYRLPTSYPLQLSGEEAAAWLNGYAALWHPAALVGATQPPQASNSYDHDTPGEDCLFAVPQGPHLYQPDDWSDRVARAGAIAFHPTTDREESFASLKAALREKGAADALLDAPADTVRLFTALGYGYLLIDMLYEAMDHERLLDADAFWGDVTAAVEAAGRQEPGFRDYLKAAADKLVSAKVQVSSSPLHLLDWAILDGNDLGAPWPDSLAANVPITLLASGETLERLAEQEPVRFAELKARILPDLPTSVDICCGSFRDREDALMPAESQWWNLRKARSTVEKLFGIETTAYGRKKSAYHPQLPSWLVHMGFKQAVLISFDGALIPTLRGTAVNWPAPDGKSIDAFTREPLAAHDPHTFFNLVYHMYQAVSQDASPSLAFSHKGKPPCESYRDLLALAELGPVVGTWTGLGRYFTDGVHGDYIGTRTADEFFADYLDERVTNEHRTDPVSGFAHQQRLRRRVDSAFTLAALHRGLTPDPGPNEEAALLKLADLEESIELRGVNGVIPFGRDPEAQEGITANPDELSEALKPLEDHWAQTLADRLQARSAPNQPGIMVFNPCGFTRRAALEIEGFGGAIPVSDPIKAAEFGEARARLVVEIPPLGYVWIPRGSASAATPPKPRIKLAEGLIVRNESFEADIDSTTGGLRGFRDLRNRSNRFGQQLVFNPGSKMKARDIRITHVGTALGEITSTGDILNDRDEVLATFRQRFRAWLGRPVLEIRIELDVLHAPTGYPWHAFYASRFGWRDERAVLFRGVNGANTQTTYTRPVSPDYLEVRFGPERSFLFTGGLPFIQRHGNRMADVILVPEGEKCSTFDLLLSLDRELPMQTAVGWVSPTPVVFTDKGPPAAGPSHWLGHIDMPSLILTSLKPCAASEGMNRAVVGQFLESSGFSGSAELRFARDPVQASIVDGMGQTMLPVTMNGDAVPLDYSASETLRVKVEWQ